MRIAPDIGTYQQPHNTAARSQHNSQLACSSAVRSATHHTNAPPADGSIFLITFALTSIYFSGIMVRLMLVAAPAFVLLGALGISGLLRPYVWEARFGDGEGAGEDRAPAVSARARKAAAAGGKGANAGGPLPNARGFAWAVMGVIALGMISYAAHCRWGL